MDAREDARRVVSGAGVTDTAQYNRSVGFVRREEPPPGGRGSESAVAKYS
ncbi:MAG TPA: hypothetical protein VFW83_04705 [Bryobacteraceae bacterium]|nr:hypothetical protein [Bryobacteraceae bacterium]